MKDFPENVFFIVTGNRDHIFLKPEEDLDGIPWFRLGMCPEKSNPASSLLKIIKDMPPDTELYVTFKRYSDE